MPRIKTAGKSVNFCLCDLKWIAGKLVIWDQSAGKSVPFSLLGQNSRKPCNTEVNCREFCELLSFGSEWQEKLSHGIKCKEFCAIFSFRSKEQKLQTEGKICFLLFWILIAGKLVTIDQIAGKSVPNLYFGSRIKLQENQCQISILVLKHRTNCCEICLIFFLSFWSCFDSNENICTKSKFSNS